MCGSARLNPLSEIRSTSRSTISAPLRHAGQHYAPSSLLERSDERFGCDAEAKRAAEDHVTLIVDLHPVRVERDVKPEKA